MLDRMNLIFFGEFGPFGLWLHMEKAKGAEKWSWFCLEITIMTYRMPSFCTFVIQEGHVYGSG